MIGETIKDFTITAQLGRGGMGDVFLAEQRLIKTTVAIKMLQPQISAEKAHVDRFFNEAIAVSKIKHAGIVKIFDVGFHGGRAYLVMEFLEGETLSNRLRRGLPFTEAIAIARQVTGVLDATHAAGITHRDLKPDNIFLVPDAELGERVRILDFGIAKLGDVKATAASMSMGTPAYMAPELWKDAATSGPPTDVYALGCVLFELCAGRPPFIVTAISDACGRHLGEIPPRIRSLRPELPAALDDLIANMLEKEQPARPSTKAIADVLGALTTAGIAATLPQSPAPQSTPAAMKPGTEPTAIGHGSDADVAKLEAEGKWMELVKLLGKQAETGDASSKAALHLKIATIYQDRFANLAEAIKSYERVLVHDADNRKALDALRALYEKRRDWEKLLELEKAELGRTAPEKRADKAVDVARLAAARVSKPDIQLYWWERVIEHEPDHRQAFAELSKLYAHAERYSDLSDILRRQADAAPGNDDRAAALRKLAFVQDSCLADRDAAIATLQEVATLDPRDADAKRALAELRAGKTFDWSALGDAWRIPTLTASMSGSWKATAATGAVSSSSSGSSASGSGSSGSTASDAGTGSSGSSGSSASGSSASGPSALGARSSASGSSGSSPSGSSASGSSSDSSASGSSASGSSSGSSASGPESDPAVSRSSGSGRDSTVGSASDSSGLSGGSLSTSRGKLVVAVGLVAALGGAGVFVATRGSKDPDSGSQAGGSQPNGSSGSQTGAQTGGAPVGSHGVAGTGQIGTERVGSQAGTGRVGSQAVAELVGSAAKAEASGLTLSYRVLAKPASGGDYHVVTPGEQLHTDDRLAFEVMVSEQAHVFLSQRPKGKALAVLFPNAGIDITNPLPPNTWTRIPSGTRSFRLNDKDIGTETVFFIASRVPPPNLAAAIANEGKPGAKQHAVEEQVVAVAMEKRDDCAGRGREIVLDGEDDCKVKTRGLELEDEKQARRVRGMTVDDVVFVPFRFEHAAGRTR